MGCALGWSSVNGNTYDPEGVDPAMYDGRVVNVNHVEEGRCGSAYDRFGRIVNVRKDAGGLRGDLEYLKAHPLAGAVAEAAERMANLFGLSHRVARGDYRGRPKSGPAWRSSRSKGSRPLTSWETPRRSTGCSRARGLAWRRHCGA